MMKLYCTIKIISLADPGGKWVQASPALLACSAGDLTRSISHAAPTKLKVINMLTSEVASVISLVVSFGGLLTAFSVLLLSFVIIYVANK